MSTSNGFHPWSLKRPERRRETRTFRDPEQPAAVLELTFQAPNALAIIDIGARAETLIQRWVTGTDDQPPQPFAPPDGGEPIEVRESFCRTVASLEAVDAAPKYDLGFDDNASMVFWLGVAVMLPDAFIDIAGWAGGFLSSAGGMEGNASGAAGGTGSPPPSSTTSPILTSSATSPPSSVASTTGLEPLPGD